MKVLATRLFATLLILVSSHAMGAEPARPEVNWDRAAAGQTIREADTRATLGPLFRLARSGENRELLKSLSGLAGNDELPAPARDYLIFKFTLGLGDLDANAVNGRVLEYLLSYEAATWVAHEENPRRAVPLYNVRAAAAGLRNSWDRQLAATRAENLLSAASDVWVNSYLEAGTASRRGFVDAMGFASGDQLHKLGNSALAQLDGHPELTLVAARAGLDSGDQEMLRQAIAGGDGPDLSRVLKTAASRLDAEETLRLLKFTIGLGSGKKAALAIAHLAPGRIGDSAVQDLLFRTLPDRELGTAAAMVLSAAEEPQVQVRMKNAGISLPQSDHARIVEWVEDAPVSETDKIALGYPVPIPVDTPMPFDGFRSYNGLHNRHQELANSSDWVHAMELGKTRDDRTIWAYQLGDADRMTADGLREHAMLTNGGIHAREWATQEVATGIMELLALGAGETDLLPYLRDNANILVIPILNIDGFLQTQRYPSTNWLGTNLEDPETDPRDGRMRRKNMLGADEDLGTQGDHLMGVDLNRNSPPYWDTNPEHSSDQPESLVHHGASAQSEPEIQALDAAALLGPPEKLSMFTDMHTFGQWHSWYRNDNDGLSQVTQGLLTTMTNHHYAFDARKYYWFPTGEGVRLNEGWGMTYEYFAEEYQVPSWVIEIEPTGGADPNWPGRGADYGGLGRNGHDGFILPDSEVERVRTEMAQTFAVGYYKQSGPPSIAAIRFVDSVTGAVVHESEWDVTGETSRQMYSFNTQPLQLDRDYVFWMAFDKPMRWRADGEVTVLPGQPGWTLDLDASLRVDDTELSVVPVAGDWLNEPGVAPLGYMRYRDDALAIGFSMPADEHNLGLLDGLAMATLGVNAWDMTGSENDADPSTVARWEEGSWAGYENSAGDDGNNSGGTDRNVQVPVTTDILNDPFVIQPGISAAWYDPARNGEGFLIEILDDNRAVMYWFTYNSEGGQDWYVAQGEVHGNRILFPQLIQVSGGEFGPGFDPGKISNEVVGSARFIWSDCGTGAMEWNIKGDDGAVSHGRMDVRRITNLMAMDCGPPILAPIYPESVLSGSWYDPTHSGEGFVLEVLVDRSLLVYWFSFDAQGNRRWFFGTGEVQGDKLVFENMLTTSGARFGADFNPDDVQLDPWGSLELELECDSGTARFNPTEQGFPAGTLNLERLTYLTGLSCGD